MKDDEKTVLNFPGKTRLDIPPAKILANAATKGATDIVVIGWDRDGDLFLMSSSPDAAEVNYLLSQAQLELLQAGREE